MRRVSIVGSLVVLVLAGLLAFGQAGPSVVAQEPRHPIIGWWLVDTSVEDPANPPSSVRFSADGGYIQVDIDGSVTLGAWEATGEQTANLTAQFFEGEGEEFFGTGTIRAAIEVDASGDALTGPYTIEFADASGASEGEFGPGTASGTRIAVEPMGTPVGSLSDLFGEPEGTPAP